MHLLQYFEYSHLPGHLQVISKQFYETAVFILHNTPSNAEQTVAIRKLLEAKDCAVRAKLYKDPVNG